jgi:hypothetical protein
MRAARSVVDTGRYLRFDRFRLEIDCDDWFTHARQIIFVKGIPEEEKARRCQVVINLRCRRAADHKPFRFTYVSKFSSGNGRIGE